MSLWSLNYFVKMAPYFTASSVGQLRTLSLQLHRGVTVDGTIDVHLRARPDGVRLRASGSDLDTCEEIFFKRVYEPVRKHVPSCRTVIDLGANIGLATLYFAWHFPDSRIVAVEPDRRNFELLSHNVSPLTAQGRCLPFHAAIWPVESTVHIGSDGDFNAKRVLSDGDSGESIRGVTMDTLFQESGVVHADLVKIDIEGSETELFRGPTGWLERSGAIAIEFHDDSRQQSGFDSIIRQHGFSVVYSSRHTVIARRT